MCNSLNNKLEKDSVIYNDDIPSGIPHYTTAYLS